MQHSVAIHSRWRLFPLSPLNTKPSRERLEAAFHEACAQYGIAPRMPVYGPQAAVQQRLL